MRPDGPPRPRCPYCSAELDYWPEMLPVHGCATCLRPLFIHPVKLARPRIYRIQTLFELAKYATAIVAILVFVGLAADLVSLRSLMAMTIIALFVHGSMDLADGILGLKSRFDKTWGKHTSPPLVPIYAGLKVAAGSAIIALSLAGVWFRL